MTYANPDFDATRTGEPFTEEEILKAIRLKDNLGLSWSVIGQRLGRTPHSVCDRVHRFRKTQRAPHKQKQAFEAKLDVMIAEVIAGGKPTVVARRHGMFKAAFYASMKRRGWDKETINEAREEKLAA